MTLASMFSPIQEQQKYRVGIMKKNQMNSAYSLPETEKIDVMNNEIFSLLSQFDQFYKRRTVTSGQGFGRSGTDNMSNSSTHQFRLFFKFSLRYEVLKFQSRYPDLALFHLVISDAIVSRKKFNAGLSQTATLSMFQSQNTSFSALQHQSQNNGSPLEQQTLGAISESAHDNRIEEQANSSEWSQVEGEVSFNNTLNKGHDDQIDNLQQPLQLIIPQQSQVELPFNEQSIAAGNSPPRDFINSTQGFRRKGQSNLDQPIVFQSGGVDNFGLRRYTESIGDIYLDDAGARFLESQRMNNNNTISEDMNGIYAHNFRMMLNQTGIDEPAAPTQDIYLQGKSILTSSTAIANASLIHSDRWENDLSHQDKNYSQHALSHHLFINNQKIQGENLSERVHFLKDPKNQRNINDIIIKSPSKTKIELVKVNKVTEQVKQQKNSRLMSNVKSPSEVELKTMTADKIKVKSMVVIQQQLQTRRVKQPRDQNDVNSPVNEVEEEDVGRDRAQSLQSASSMKSSVGTHFVSEIINERRLPSSARKLGLLSKITFLSMVCAFSFEYFFVSSVVQGISEDLNNFTILADFTDSYSRGLLGITGLHVLNEGLTIFSDAEALKAQCLANIQTSENNFNQAYEEIENTIVDVSYGWSFYNLIFYNFYTLTTYQTALPIVSFMQQIQQALLQLSVKHSEKSPKVETTFQFLRRNFVLFTQLMEETDNILLSRVKVTADSASNSFLLFTMAYSIASFLLVSCSIPVIQRINTYREKIMLLVTRVSIEEADFEIEKYRHFFNQIVNTKNDDPLMSIDFFAVYRKKFRVTERVSTENTVKNKDGKDVALKASAATVNQIKKTSTIGLMMSIKNRIQSQIKKSQALTKTKVQGKIGGLNSTSTLQTPRTTHLVSSKILEHKLSYFSYFARFAITSSAAIIVLQIILVFVLSAVSKIIPTLDLSSSIIKSHHALNNLNVCIELLAVEQQLSLKISYSPVATLADRTDLTTMLAASKIKLDNFLSDNLNSIYGNTKSMNTNAMNRIIRIFQGDLCQDFSMHSDCINFKEGVSGIITKVKQFVLSYSAAVFDEKTFPSGLNVEKYLQSNERRALVSNAFETSNAALNEISNIIIFSCVDAINNITTLVKILVILLGPLVLIFQGILLYSGTNTTYNQLRSLNLLLSLIPEDKITSEATLQILKTLRTF